MAALVRRSLSNAKTGFVQRDQDYCSAVIADDEEVALLERQVDRAGTNVLMRFQPLASDFRAVLATIKLSSHLENISDQAVNIARRVRVLIQKSELYSPGESGADHLFDRKHYGGHHLRSGGKRYPALEKPPFRRRGRIADLSEPLGARIVSRRPVAWSKVPADFDGRFHS
jgi:PhoU domain